jgi:hypothetical protein
MASHKALHSRCLSRSSACGFDAERTVEMTVEKLASDLFREFNAKPESQHIASEFALIELSRLIARVKPGSVLEIGAGIGTITKLVLTHPDRPKQLTSTEGHPVCLSELSKNLKGVELTGYTLVNSATELALNQRYDLVIFDGTLDDEQQYAVFSSGTWCFVEGNRSKTMDVLKQKLAKRGMTIAFEKKRPDPKKFRLFSSRRFLGLRLPALMMNPVKGCSLGQVFGAEAVVPS